MAIESYSHIVNDVVTTVTRQFGDEAQIQIDSADIIRWINMGQREIVTNNTSINRVVARTSIVAGQASYPLDADSAFKGIQKLTAVMVDGLPLTGMTFQEALAYLKAPPSSSATGVPSIWYSEAGMLNLWPKPDKNITNGLAIYFIKAPPVVAVIGDKLGVPDNFYNALVQYVLQQAYELDENFQAAGIKGQQFEKSVNIQQNQNDTADDFYPTITLDPGDVY